MKRSGFSRIISFVMAFAVLTCTLFGCGHAAAAKENKEAAGPVDKNVVFHEKPSALDSLFNDVTAQSLGSEGGEIYINTVLAVSGRYYVCYSRMDGEEKTSLLSFDADGNSPVTFDLPLPENGLIAALSVAPDGTIYAASEVMEEESVSWNLTAIDAKGKKVRDQALGGGENFYVQSMVSTERETWLQSDEEVRVIDNAKGTERTVEKPSTDYYGKLCNDSRGDVILVGSTDKGLSAWKYDDKKAAFSEVKIQTDDFWGGEGFSSGSGPYDFYAGKDDGLYGFTLNGSGPVKVLDYLASDLEIGDMQNCALLSAENAVIVSYGSDSGVHAALLQKVDPALVGDRTVLTLATTYASAELRSAIVNYNKSNDKYRVALKEYEYDDAGNSLLNTEIASGNIPDMFCVTPQMPVESYASKGLFEDLEPMFTSDAEISKNKYLGNVLDAFRIDGKMYFVTPSFSVLGLMGKKKDFKDTKGITIDQLDKMIKGKGLSYDTAMGVASKDSILSWNLFYAMDQYVDWDKGTCSFDSDSFIKLLKFAAKFPGEINYDSIDWEKAEAGMRDGTQLVRDSMLYSFDAYTAERYGYVGEEITYMGYPGNGSNGPVIQEEMAIAMSHAARDKEGCWDFLRSLYLDDYQNSIQYSFPVSRKALKARAESAMNPKTYTYTDENGKEVQDSVSNTLFLNGKEIDIPVPKQADIDVVMNILDSLQSKAAVDTNISKIINEEAGAFFAGQKSAETVADVIQSRVQVYISETK